MKSPPKPAPMTLNLAPMVDVMMCLIIFFLLASKLATSEFDVELPWAISAKVVDQAQLGNAVTIGVRPSPEDERTAEYVVADWDGQQVVQRALTPDQIETLLMARSVRAHDRGEELRCVIRADRGVMYQHVEVVLRACGLAKISKIVFPAQKGAGPAAAEEAA